MKKSAKKTKGAGRRAKTDLTPRNARGVKGGAPQKADGSLDAGINFKYDLKAQKEA